MPKLMIYLTLAEENRLKALAVRERRDYRDQLAFMASLLLDVFEELPSYMDHDEQSDVLLRLLRDAVQSEQGKELIALKEHAAALQQRLDEVANLAAAIQGNP